MVFHSEFWGSLHICQYVPSASRSTSPKTWPTISTRAPTYCSGSVFRTPQFLRVKVSVDAASVSAVSLSSPSGRRVTTTTSPTMIIAILSLENLLLLLHQARTLPNLDWPVLLTTFPSLLVSHPRD